MEGKEETYVRKRPRLVLLLRLSIKHTGVLLSLPPPPKVGFLRIALALGKNRRSTRNVSGFFGVGGSALTGGKGDRNGMVVRLR